VVIFHILAALLLAKYIAVRLPRKRPEARQIRNMRSKGKLRTFLKDSLLKKHENYST
jgi:hypothetical protein